MSVTKRRGLHSASMTCVPCNHAELVAEMPRLDGMSNAARLKHAKRRRKKQMETYQSWMRQQRASTNGRARPPRKRTIDIENAAKLNDLASRNDIIGGEGCVCVWGGGGGGVRACVCVCARAYACRHMHAVVNISVERSTT